MTAIKLREASMAMAIVVIEIVHSGLRSYIASHPPMTTDERIVVAKRLEALEITLEILKDQK